MPSTASLITTTIAPVTMLLWTRETASVAPAAPNRAPVPAPRDARLRTRISSWPISTTTNDRPSSAFGFIRIDAKAPSRISPTASGRSGITPGLSAGGGDQDGTEYWGGPAGG